MVSLIVFVLFLFTKAATTNSVNLNAKDGIPQRSDPKRWSAASQNAASMRSRGISALEIAAEQVSGFHQCLHCVYQAIILRV